jgi:hypothetical protein
MGTSPHRNKKAMIITQLLLSAILLISCAESTVYTSKSLREITLSSAVDKQLNPIDATTVFNSDTKQIFCSFDPSELPTGTKITASWIYLKGEATDLNNYIIEEWSEIIKQKGSMAMLIRRPPNGWPKGNYVVVLLVNDKEEIGVLFEVK